MASKLLRLLIAAVILSSCTSKIDNNTVLGDEAIDGWKIFTEDEYHIQYPDNWDLKEPQTMGISLIMLSPLSSDTDRFRDNINLLIQDLSGQGIDMDMFVQISENQINKMLTNAKIIESERVIQDESNNYHKIIYSGKQGIFNLKFEQFYWIQNSTAYILTLTCEESQFENYKATGEKILHSFKLK